jgi:hypothetical protein
VDARSGSAGSPTSSTELEREPGSFRDPKSRIYYGRDGEILRALSAGGLEDWHRVAATQFFPRLVEAGKIVATEVVEDGLLRHEAIPFVSYPYEWSFGMLKDGALLQLELMEAALAEDVILKDASPYNVQWRGARPLFIDVGSFEPLEPGEPWAGYRQFCQLYLYPLMLQAWKDVPFAPWLRGRVEGIEPRELRNLLSARDRFRRGVFTHVVLHERLARREAGREHVRADLRAAGFNKELIRANVRKLRRLVERLEWEPRPTAWTRYGPETTYHARDAERKAEFVRVAAAARRRRLVWDLGANDGSYTRLAAEHADYAVALDGDAAVVERLYRSLRAGEERSILPLAVDLADPSPGLGWRGRERRTLRERGRPDLVLCLALVHHLALSANVPPAELVDWLRELEAEVVIELVTREDPMARALLARKREGLHEDYERAEWERLLGAAFEVERTEELADGARVLYLARPRA